MNKLVIFDMDGLLVDSEPLQMKAYIKAFGNNGYEMTEKEYIKEWIQGGATSASYVQKLKMTTPENEKALSQKIRTEKKNLYEKMIENELVLKDGALDLLNNLFGKIDMVIASSARQESIDLITKKFGIAKYFKKLHAGADHPRPKPFPDTFLELADEFKVNADECVVIEDAEKGLIAAKAAGMKCIICPNKLTKDANFERANIIIDSLKKLNFETICNL